MVLDDVLHSMGRLGSFDDSADDENLWYGDDEVIDSWLSVVESELEKRYYSVALTNPGGGNNGFESSESTAGTVN